MLRKIAASDRDEFVKMADEFYHTDAVMKPVPVSHHEKAFDEMMRSSDYLNGYIFEYDGETAGFCVTAKTYSQEAGGIVIWIEDLYIRPQFRSKGLGTQIFKEVEQNGDPNLKRIRLEVEEDNERAVALYSRLGFKKIPYGGMYKEF